MWRLATGAAVLAIEERESRHVHPYRRLHVSTAIDRGTSVRDSGEEILTSLQVRRTERVSARGDSSPGTSTSPPRKTSPVTNCMVIEIPPVKAGDDQFNTCETDVLATVSAM